MLVLSRKLGEEVRIGPDIRIRVVRITNSQVRLAIEAPANVHIARADLPGRQAALALATMAVTITQP